MDSFDFENYVKLIKSMPKKQNEHSMTLARALGKDRNENFISDCLAFIINPGLFGDENPYRAFMSLADLNEDLEIPNQDGVEREVSFHGDNGRIDLLIRTDNYLIGIENKIDSGVGATQLKRYSNALSAYMYDDRRWHDDQIISVLLYPEKNRYVDEIKKLYGFKKVTYEQLINAFEELSLDDSIEPISRIVFDNFITHIKEEIIVDANKYYDTNEDLLTFCDQNRDELRELQDSINNAREVFNNMIYSALQEAIPNENGVWQVGKVRAGFVQVFKTEPKWNEELQVHFELMFYGKKKSTEPLPYKAVAVFHSHEGKYNSAKTEELINMQNKVEQYLTTAVGRNTFIIDYSSREGFYNSMNTIRDTVKDLISRFEFLIDNEVEKSLKKLYEDK